MLLFQEMLCEKAWTSFWHSSALDPSMYFLRWDIICAPHKVSSTSKCEVPSNHTVRSCVASTIGKRVRLKCQWSLISPLSWVLAHYFVTHLLGRTAKGRRIRGVVYPLKAAARIFCLVLEISYAGQVWKGSIYILDGRLYFTMTRRLP